MNRIFSLMIAGLALVALEPLAGVAPVCGQNLSLTESVPTAETKERIQALIQQLGAEKYRDRQRAETELKKIGLVAIEPLQAVSPYDDTEVRLRARRLVYLLRKQFVEEGVPPSLRHYFVGYEEMSVGERRTELAKLIALPISLESGLLARLARFEADDENAKLAALAILRKDIDDPKVREKLLIGIGYSERSACKWIRSYVQSYDQPDQALLELRDLLAEEQKLMAVGSALTFARCGRWIIAADCRSPLKGRA